ncbi:MAG: sigma-54 factor interaction domain-containing protein, partial [Myxococcales bacterium]
GELARGQGELIDLLSSTHLSRPARALASAGAALVEVLLRSDGRSALAALGGSLTELETLSTRARGLVLAVAALVHSSHDARLFDLGRVQSYAARLDELATEEPESWLLGQTARIQAAFMVGDEALLRRTFGRLAEQPLGELPAVLGLVRDEMRGCELMISGQLAPAIAQFSRLLERAEALGLVALQARSLGFLAKLRLDELGPPEECLALARRSQQVARQGRLGLGTHTLHAMRAEAEALMRLGRFDEVEQALAEADVYRAATGLEPMSATIVLVRYAFLRGRDEQLEVLRGRLGQCPQPDLVPVYRAQLAFVEAVVRMATSHDPAATVAAFARAEVAAERWPLLLRDVLIYGVAARTIAQDPDARLTLRRAQRLVDQAPSPWGVAQLRRFEAVLIAAEGDWATGRQLLDASIATFELGHDLADLLLARYTQAAFARAYGDPGGEELLAACTRELDRLGLRAPRGLQVGLSVLEQRRAGRAPVPSHGGDLERLTVPFQRLAVRGMAPPVLLRELWQVLGGLWPGRPVAIEELDSRGQSALVEGEAPGPSATWLEFGDGTGRRLRAGVAGPLGREDRASLGLLTTAAGLALEVATMRTLGAPGALADEAPELPGLVVVSPAMRRLRDDLVRLSASRSTVILTGESGSGKEVLASTLHRLSPRARHPYVTFNCATVPRDLFEGQLFGHKKGAFTGADRDQPGIIRAAEGGTLFLDEIGELPLSVQPKLLRFLENGEVLPLGAQRATLVDVRIIAATHRDLAEMVRVGAFREDLYYRLQVVPVRVPPLRERRDDVLPLARFFLRQLTDGAPPP